MTEQRENPIYPHDKENNTTSSRKGVNPDNQNYPGKGVFTQSSAHEKKEAKELCMHRFRQLEKRREPNRLCVLVRCRRCQRSGVETYQTNANSRAVFVKKEFEWLD